METRSPHFVGWDIVLMDKIKLKWRIFAYLLAFCVLLIGILWIFQTVLLNEMYKFVRKNEINQAISLVEANINSPELENILVDLKNRKDMIITLSQEFVPPSNPVPLNPKQSGPETLTKSQLFTLSNGREISLTFHALITPVDATVSTLKLQLYIITGLMIFFAIILAIIISKRISNPIENITQGAKALAAGNLDIQFDGHGFLEIRELSDTLTTAAAELSKVDDLRRELMANVSHDLRTPLALIYGYAEMMHDFPDEVAADQTQTIMDEVQRLSQLVGDVLDISSLESGMMEVHPERYNLTESLAATIARTAELVNNTGTELVFVFDRQVFVIADEIKITQAFYNLLINATNHNGPDNSIIVRQLVKDQKVRIEVQDHGEGIPVQEIPHIWKRYSKTNKASQKIAGTGLGLSIVRKIIELHHGSCGVDSELGAGSTFWFELDAA
ncbi:MAG: HAMP domain-containing histidine kinase [Chloroflexi bacterium]|nr:HAMP domain-containing histidine kinase [Chloroflexota bacterium]